MARLLRALRRGAAACVLALLPAAVASAQAPVPSPGPADRPASPDFLTRYAFHLAASKLAIDDPRFSWDTHFGGDIDAVDYGAGRLNLLADYDAVLGSEFRAFDPEQGNYTLEASASMRAAGAEFAAVLHHLSRHLGDRPKRFGVDWNALELRALKRFEPGGWRVDGQVSAGPVIKHDFVDYTWIVTGEAKATRALTARAGLFAAGAVEMFGVDPAIAGRGTQRGGRVEAGVRLSGAGGAIELFGGFEQRIDAYQLDRVPLRWALAGFRIVNR